MAPAQAIEPKDLPPEVLMSEPATALQVSSAEAPALHASSSVAKPVVLNAPSENWQAGLEAEAMSLLASGRVDVWDEMTRRFEASLIQTALAHTRGRRIDAAHKLGIGRNTITRKIQELGLE
jgi:two-component system nitrogen regulation response regulator GlnG